MKMRIKEQYREGLMVEGVRYDLGGYNDEKLKMVWEGNPHLRFAFEEESIAEGEFFAEEVVNVDGVELPKSLDINTPEEFSAAIKKSAKAPKRKGK